ncbi:hypothetical protein SAMN05443377_11618 [Propionibacterium cyclohexanicum]|uniref:Uncharacterized protein n=1 Tax=Propionibacterium cyclohexanicum TaxID=64702 RepID=A0A1H9SUQ6_9ACTN|nr:hypothetical protein [Propionibacterium cyclohexanicum]SER88595.1 hypothetical protein SAMN05443377_11618 [Propionibacterium cyclohexanicum]
MAQAVTRRGFGVGVESRTLAQRAKRLRARLVQQAISAVLGTIVSVILYVGFGGGGGAGSPLSVLVIAAPALYGWIRLVAELVRRHDMNRALRLIEPGPVLRVERPGLVLRNGDRLEYLRWEQISSIRGVRRFDLPGPLLQVERADHTVWSVPFALLDAKPGGIDAAVRAYAGGRFGLDMAACDDIW